MPEIFRPIAPHRLDAAKLTLKFQKDTEYEQAVQAISKPFYAKKKSVGVTAQEQADFDAASNKLWDDYLAWAKSAGLYEAVSVDQQRQEAESGLAGLIAEVNALRTELGLKAISLRVG
jgi:hypothetical protein